MNRLIYIVEDDTAIKELESYALINSEFSVEGFERGKELFDALTTKIPALILLDIMLPDEDGIHILKKIRSTMAYRDIPVIMVTAKTTEIDAVKGLDMGADDYITKPFYTKELLSRISANLRRSKFNAGNIYKKGDIVVDFDRYKISRNGVELNISTNEFDIIKILIENKGRVVRRDVIYEKIWDVRGNFVEYNTLTVAMSRIKAKLGTYGEKHQQYIETIRNVGYRWID